jgi:hypothetical protein
MDEPARKVAALNSTGRRADREATAFKTVSRVVSRGLVTQLVDTN